MAEHLLHDRLLLPLPRPQVFAFFADAGNLGRITPPELNFRFLTPLPVEMRPGTLIDYRLQLHGVPFHWQSEITVWEPPTLFVDEQRRGPYRQWIHSHRFSDSADGGTLIEDEVRYRLPLAPFGDALHPVVRQQLERIFAYRRAMVAQLLLPSSGGATTG